MNQQINLYLPEFRVKKDALTAVVMGQVAAGVVAIMLLVSAVDYYRAWSLSGEADALRTTLQQETQRTNQLNDQLLSLIHISSPKCTDSRVVSPNGRRNLSL